jgi:hypothetical protein
MHFFNQLFWTFFSIDGVQSRCPDTITYGLAKLVSRHIFPVPSLPVGLYFLATCMDKVCVPHTNLTRTGDMSGYE